MDLLVCVDDGGGILFNHRRQSQDRTVRDFILSCCNGSPLWLSPYSRKQFIGCDDSLFHIDENFLTAAPEGALCFAECGGLLDVESRIRKVILVRWNRKYPADVYMDLPLSEKPWHCTETREFPGYSHEKITVEVYEK